MRVTRGRILVIRGGAIGDFILTLPAIIALRRHFSGAQLEVLGYPHIAQLALVGGLVDRVQPIEARGLAGFFARGGSLDAAMTDYFARFDLIVSYLYDPDEIFKINVANCSRAQFIQGPHRPDETERRHATQVYLKPLEGLAIFDADPVPRLNLAPGPRRPTGQPWEAGSKRDGAVTVALHPGSGSEKKNWPEPNWAALLQSLVTETAMRILVVGGEAEGERLERLATNLPAERVQIVRSRPLAELAGCLRRCAAFAGHDSGISHLATALGVPTLVLWGDTVEEVWRPQGERVVIVRETGGLNALTVGRVWRELQAVIASSLRPAFGGAKPGRSPERVARWRR